MASITINTAPSISSGTVTVYPKSNWAYGTAISGAPVGASVTTGTVGTDGSVPLAGLTEGVNYVAYQASPDRYVSFSVSDKAGTGGSPSLVDSTPPAGFVLVDAATQAATVFHGLTVRETAGAAAVLRIRDTNVTGAILDTIGLVAGESRSEHYPRGRACAALYVQVVSGTVEGRVFYR